MLPADLALLFKALITLEGFGRQYDPEFRLVERAEPFLNRAMSERYQPVEAWRRGQATFSDFLGLVASIGWFAGLDSGARLRRARNQEYRQTPHALGTVNQNALDIGGCGRARYQHRIARRLKPRVAISVMQVTNDIAGIE